MQERLWRIWVLLCKDLYWAAGNFKLLGIMVMPVLFVVIFSRIDSESIFAFNLSFINSFIGIFSTSYLIIEEKNKGTLLSLLTTPVRSFELLFSKFLFNLSLCLSVSAFAMIYNARWDLLSSPWVNLNVALFAGFTCFIGCVVGMFFKNEQEMSIFSPLLMFFFILGDVTDKMTSGIRAFGFFPDFHLSRIVRDMDMGLTERLAHTGFNFYFFAVGLLMAALYTQFYFANHRETRVSKALYGFCLLLLTSFIGSGLLYAKDPQRQVLGDGRVQQKFLSPQWSGTFEFDRAQHKLLTMEQSQKKSFYRLRPIDKTIGYEITLSLSQPPAGLRTESARLLYWQNKKATLISGPLVWKTHKMHRHVLVGKKEQRVVTEGFCRDQLLSFSLEIELEKVKQLPEAMESYNRFVNLLTANCQESI